MGILLNYYPVLFLMFYIVVIIGLIIKYSVNKSSRNKERKRYINSVNNINRLMSNKPHITDEAKLVDVLSKENIIYRGTE